MSGFSKEFSFRLFHFIPIPTLWGRYHLIFVRRGLWSSERLQSLSNYTFSNRWSRGWVSDSRGLCSLPQKTQETLCHLSGGIRGAKAADAILTFPTWEPRCYQEEDPVLCHRSLSTWEEAACCKLQGQALQQWGCMFWEGYALFTAAVEGSYVEWSKLGQWLDWAG